MNTEEIITTSKLTALASFLIGTLIWGLYFLTSTPEWLFVGYLFIIVAALINLILLYLILVKSYRATEYKKKYGQQVYS
jgi:uncharacterized membrane protein